MLTFMQSPQLGISLARHIFRRSLSMEETVKHFDELCANAPAESTNSVRGLLVPLSPVVSAAISGETLLVGPNSLDQWTIEGRLTFPYVFDKYFLLATPI